MKIRVRPFHMLGILVLVLVGLSIFMITAQGFFGLLGVAFVWMIAIGVVAIIVLWQWFQQLLKKNPVVYWMLLFFLILTGLALTVTVVGASVGVMELIVAAGMILSYVAQAAKF